MPREIKTFQILKAGTFTAMDGTVVTMDDSMLSMCAAAYNPTLYAAPLVLGHPKLDAPRYGDVMSLFMDGGGLFAKAEVDDQLIEWVRAKRYTNVSASLYMPGAVGNPAPPGVYYLRHVGFLGANAPAVKGMQPLSFSEWPERPLSPLIADAERRCLERNGTAPAELVDFAQTSHSNPLVCNAERRARQHGH